MKIHVFNKTKMKAFVQKRKSQRPRNKFFYDNFEMQFGVDPVKTFSRYFKGFAAERYIDNGRGLGSWG